MRERTASLGWQGWRNVDVAHGGLARGYAPGMMHAAGLLRTRYVRTLLLYVGYTSGRTTRASTERGHPYAKAPTDAGVAAAQPLDVLKICSIPVHYNNSRDILYVVQASVLFRTRYVRGIEKNNARRKLYRDYGKKHPCCPSILLRYTYCFCLLCFTYICT